MPMLFHSIQFEVSDFDYPTFGRFILRI